MSSLVSPASHPEVGVALMIYIHQFIFQDPSSSRDIEMLLMVHLLKDVTGTLTPKGFAV